jgi:hypothetical protein
MTDSKPIDLEFQALEVNDNDKKPVNLDGDGIKLNLYSSNRFIFGNGYETTTYSRR